jgi:hypothetical protein
MKNISCTVALAPILSVVLSVILSVVGGSSAFAQNLVASVPTQLSVGVGGVAPDSHSENVVLSPNSGMAVFESAASNLVADDTNQRSDVFLRDTNGAITRANVSSDGVQGDAGARSPALSQVASNGAYAVAFVSQSTNLVPGVTPGDAAYSQVYLRIYPLNKTILISRGYDGSGSFAGQGNSEHPSVVATDNGAKFIVAFDSSAYNIVKDAVPNSPNGALLKRIFFAEVNASDGSMVVSAFTGINGVQADGDIVEPVLSGYGDQMLFRTNASNMGWMNSGAFNYQVALADKSKLVQLISKSPIDGSPGLESSHSHILSFNGSQFIFTSTSSNIFDGSAASPSIVAYSVASKSYTRVNETELGVKGNSYLAGNTTVGVDPKGRLVAFIDWSSNYLPDGEDTNKMPDVYVKDLQTKKIIRVNVGSGGVQVSDARTEGVRIGTLGYNSRTATVGFESISAALRQVGSMSLSDVYRVLLTFPPPPLTKDTVLETPPDVQTGPRKLILTLQKFDSASLTVSAKAAAPKKATISYDVRLTETSKNKKLKVISTRNRIILRNLTPGQYTVKYRVVGTPTKGKKVVTRFSPPVTVTVKKK